MTYYNNSFGVYHEKPLRIELEFDKDMAENVLNYHFHPTQKMKKLDSGNIQIKIKLNTNGRSIFLISSKELFLLRVLIKTGISKVYSDKRA